MVFVGLLPDVQKPITDEKRRCNLCNTDDILVCVAQYVSGRATVLSRSCTHSPLDAWHPGVLHKPMLCTAPLQHVHAPHLGLQALSDAVRKHIVQATCPLIGKHGHQQMQGALEHACIHRQSAVSGALVHARACTTPTHSKPSGHVSVVVLFVPLLC